MTTVVKYTRGIEKEPNTVYIGRAWGPFKQASKWANPFKTGRDGNLEEVLAKYEEYLIASGLFQQIPELKDKVLICWCKPADCHGDVLLKLLNIVDFGIDEY